MIPFRELYVSEIGATVSWRRKESGHGFKCDEYTSDHGGNINAATRRVIVRAAAAIEDSKPEVKSVVFCTTEVLRKIKDAL